MISQSFASAEEAFGSSKSLLNLRDAFIDARANGVTVLGSSGDGGTANGTSRASSARTRTTTSIPYPTVEWPASDPLVTGVGGTYLCTNADHGRRRRQRRARRRTARTSQPGDRLDRRGRRLQPRLRPARLPDTLPAGSTPIPSTQRGVPDVGLQASSRTGALVYLTLPPDGKAA